MAPKRNQSGGPTTTVLGLSKMTPSLLDDLARRGFVSADDVRAPPTGETVAHPRNDEVVVFRDLFTAGLQMPLDPVVVDIFRLFKVYLHQMTPTSIVRLNLYMWLAKTCRLSPSAEGFARAFRVHYQPKKISVESTVGAEISTIPQYGCYTFTFHKNLPSPVPASKNKWANDWSSYWFYHKVTLDPSRRPIPSSSTALLLLAMCQRPPVMSESKTRFFLPCCGNYRRPSARATSSKSSSLAAAFPSGSAGTSPAGWPRTSGSKVFRYLISRPSSAFEPTVSFRT